MTLLNIRLPKKGEIVVNPGQKVASGDLLAQGKTSQKISLNLAKLLNVNPKKVKKLILKKIGQEVQEGETIAQKASLFAKMKVKSPASGTLESLDELEGVLLIRTAGDDFTLRALFSGRVANITDGELVLEIDGIEIEAEVGIGEKREGKLTIAKNSQIQLSDLTSDLAGKIVAAQVWDLDTLCKAQALGVAAILGQEFKAEDWEKRGLTVLGFSSENFAKVIKYDGFPSIAWGEDKTLIIAKDH